MVAQSIDSKRLENDRATGSVQNDTTDNFYHGADGTGIQQFDINPQNKL